MDKPVEFLNLLGKVTTKLLFVQTHYSQEKDWLYDHWWTSLFIKIKRKFLNRGGGKINYNLSPLATNEGQPGRWFFEYTPKTSRKEVEQNLKAAYSNERSFWLTKKALLEAIQAAGFPIVYEQYDFLKNIQTDPYIERQDRSLFVGVK